MIRKVKARALPWTPLGPEAPDPILSVPRLALTPSQSAGVTGLRDWYRRLPPRSEYAGGGTPSGGPGGRAPWSAKPPKFNSLISLYNPYLRAYGALPLDPAGASRPQTPLALRGFSSSSRRSPYQTRISGFAVPPQFLMNGGLGPSCAARSRVKAPAGPGQSPGLPALIRALDTGRRSQDFRQLV